MDVSESISAADNSVRIFSKSQENTVMEKVCWSSTAKLPLATPLGIMLQILQQKEGEKGLYLKVGR